ncbi:copper amine oxidase N-terminal domain-containing protein [Cohnella sp.]|uniref:copper amine oxidase N-terminal domain-containing protein n=1 Tax=Cohnella sp. TaxID=1883426 RepID=UPI00356A3829
MRTSWMIIVSCVMAVSLMTGSAFAKSENGKGADKKEVSTGNSKSGEGKIHVELEVEDDTDASVTSATYGKGHKGYKGLLNAINNVKDKPAGAVIAELLLTKYDTQLTAEMKAELEAIVEKDAALSAVADMLAESGSVTDAVYVQKEAVLANVKNLESYKKLGKLYEKTGKKGIKLYVNGEEPDFETAPFVRSGKTLVPFRAISEALNADVSWNKEERSVSVTRDGITVKLFIDSKTAYVDGKPITLDVPAAIVKGSTVVPVRFVSEALKAAVKWEPESESVVIYEE